MLIIRKLAEMIGEELDDAEKYIRCAISEKEQHPALAEVFAKLSDEEMRHMAILHEQVVKLIRDYKASKGEPPPAMMAVYDYLHKQHTDRTVEVRAMQDMYRNG